MPLFHVPRQPLCTDDRCQHCGEDAPETLQHIFWECPAWSEQRMRHLPPSLADKMRDEPVITREHGILPMLPRCM